MEIDKTIAAAPAKVEEPAKAVEAKKEEAKKPAAKKAPAKKPAAKKAAVPKKAAAKKPAAKKAPAKKAAPKAIVAPKTFVIQNVNGDGVSYTDIVKKVNKDCKAAIKNLDIYVKAEEGKAYYVVNGDIFGDVDLF